MQRPRAQEWHNTYPREAHGPRNDNTYRTPRHRKRYGIVIGPPQPMPRKRPHVFDDDRSSTYYYRPSPRAMARAASASHRHYSAMTTPAQALAERYRATARSAAPYANNHDIGAYPIHGDRSRADVNMPSAMPVQQATPGREFRDFVRERYVRVV